MLTRGTKLAPVCPTVRAFRRFNSHPQRRVMPWEAPVLTEDGGVGSYVWMSGLCGRGVVDLSDERNANCLADEHRALVREHGAVWDEYSKSVFRVCARYKRKKSKTYSYPSAWTASDSHVVLAYHGVSDQVTRMEDKVYDFDKVHYLHAHPYAQPKPSMLATMVADRPEDGVGSGDARRMAVGAEPGVADTFAQDPITNRLWDLADTCNVDMCLVEVADAARHVLARGPVLLPAVFDEQELVGQSVGFLGYSGPLRDEDTTAVLAEFRRRTFTPTMSAHELAANEEAFEVTLNAFKSGNKMLSCGEVMAVDAENPQAVATTCSSALGCSSSPYFSLAAPQEGVLGLHLGGGVTANPKQYADHTLFLSVNAPQFVAKYFRYVYPRLNAEHRRRLEPYVAKHQAVFDLVQAQAEAAQKAA